MFHIWKVTKSVFWIFIQRAATSGLVLRGGQLIWVWMQTQTWDKEQPLAKSRSLITYMTAHLVQKVGRGHLANSSSISFVLSRIAYSQGTNITIQEQCSILSPVGREEVQGH